MIPKTCLLTDKVRGFKRQKNENSTCDRKDLLFFFFSVCTIFLPSWPQIGYGALHFGPWEYHIKVTGFEPMALWNFFICYLGASFLKGLWRQRTTCLPSWPRIDYGALHFSPWEYHIKVTGFEPMALWNFFIGYLGAYSLKWLWQQMTYLTTADNIMKSS